MRGGSFFLIDAPHSVLIIKGIMIHTVSCLNYVNPRSLLFFSPLSRRKEPKEELSGSHGYSDVCGRRVRTLSRHPATFWKRWTKTLT